MLALLEEIIGWLGPAFVAAGYYIVAAGVLLERSVFLGLFVPGDVILALGGIYAARGSLSLTLVVVVASAAAAAGESIGFMLGRRYGVRLIRKLPLVNRLEVRLEGARDYFRRHGGKTVAVGRFATAAGSFIPFVAGLSAMSYARFLLFDVPAIAVWASSIALVGYLFGQNLEVVERILSRGGWAVLGLVVGFVVGRMVWKRYRSPGGPDEGASEG